MNRESADMGGRDIEFASLLCSRLCHDLMSPVGAFGNGLELLADETDPALRDQYVALLDASARASVAKLKYFRLAFGASGGLGAQLASAEAKTVLEDFFADKKDFSLGWMVAAPTLSKSEIRILLILAMIAGDSLLRGGRLDVGVEGGEIVIRAEGPRLKLDEDIRDALLGSGALDLSSRTAAAMLTRDLAIAAGGSVQISYPGEGVLLLGAVIAAQG